MEFDTFYSSCDEIFEIDRNRKCSTEGNFYRPSMIQQFHHYEYDNSNGWRVDTSNQSELEACSETLMCPSDKIQILTNRSALKEKNVTRFRGDSKTKTTAPTGDKMNLNKNKLPQIVEKRNARERRRVQAVNSAFSRLRKAVPIENSRGKRISKVKTLQKAIEYINALENLLKNDDGIYCYQTVHFQTCYLTPSEYFYSNRTHFEN